MKGDMQSYSCLHTTFHALQYRTSRIHMDKHMHAAYGHRLRVLIHLHLHLPYRDTYQYTFWGGCASAKAFSHLGTHAHGQDGHVALCISLYPLFAISLYPYPYTHSSHAPHQCQDKAPIAITPTNMYISVWVPTPCFMHSLLHAAMPMAHAFMRMGALCVWGLYAYGGFMRMGALCVCGLHAYGGFMRMGEQWAIGIKTVGIGG